MSTCSYIPIHQVVVGLVERGSGRQGWGIDQIPGRQSPSELKYWPISGVRRHYGQGLHWGTWDHWCRVRQLSAPPPRKSRQPPPPPINPLPREGDGWQSLGCDHFSELPCNVTRLCINEKGSSVAVPIILDPVFMPMTPRGPGSLRQKHCWRFNLITQPISSTMIFQIFYLAQTELVKFLLRSCRKWVYHLHISGHILRGSRLIWNHW